MALERELYADDVEHMTAHQRRGRAAAIVERELYADDVRRMNAHQGRRRDARRRDRRYGLSPWAALAIAGGAMAISALVGRRYSPEPSHPDIERWYHDLDKPSYTPPDPVFGAVWPALEVLLAVGGYRLLRAAPGRDRDTALALWLFYVAMIGGWTKSSSASGALPADCLPPLTCSPRAAHTWSSRAASMASPGPRVCPSRRGLPSPPSCPRKSGAVIPTEQGRGRQNTLGRA